MSVLNCVLHNTLGNNTEVGNSVIGSNGTWTGTPAYTAVKFGNGININAVNPANQYVTIPTSNFDPNNFVIDTWVKPNFSMTNGVAGGLQRGLVSWFYDSNNFVIADFEVTRCVLYVKVGGVFNLFIITTGMTWTAGSINNLLYCYNQSGIDGSTTCMVYLNESRIFTSTLTPTIQTNTTGTFYVGAFLTTGLSAGFNGGIDNIRIYNNTDFLENILATKDYEYIKTIKRR